MKIKLKWNKDGSFIRIMSIPDGEPPKEVTISWGDGSLDFGFSFMDEGVAVYHLKKRAAKRFKREALKK